MSDPVIKKPTKKTFHFPTGAEEKSVAAEKPVEAAPARTTKKPAPKAAKKSAMKAEAAATKASRPKRAAAAVAEATPADAAPEEKSKRAKKEKVVRDSFTMPKSDYAKIAHLKEACLEAGISVKKSELLRAGLLLLASVPIKQLLSAVSAVETVKTGRPAKS